MPQGPRPRPAQPYAHDLDMAVQVAGLDAAGADVHFDALHDDQSHGEHQEGVGDGHGVQMPLGGVALDQVAQQRPPGEQGEPAGSGPEARPGPSARRSARARW